MMPIVIEVHKLPSVIDIYQLVKEQKYF